MTRRAALAAGLLSILVSLAISTWAYQVLPEHHVPTHWDLSGQANGFSSRGVAVSIFPALMILIWLLAVVLPIISPRGFRLEPSANQFYICMTGLIAVLLVFDVITTRIQVTGAAMPARLIFIPIGALLVLIGSVMGKLKRNFFIGIRTPWTLASEEVWKRTNRLGGYTLMLAGAAVIGGSLVPNAALLELLAIVVLGALVPVVYSYVLYRRIEGFRD